MSRQESFFLVWCPTGKNPSYRHATYADAAREAKRLALAVPDQEFYVLEAHMMAKHEPVKITEFSTMEVPF